MIKISTLAKGLVFCYGKLKVCECNNIRLFKWNIVEKRG